MERSLQLHKAASFKYRLNVQCPTSSGRSATQTVTGSLSVGPNSGKTITVFSNTFDGTGSVHYSGTLYFGQYSKTSQGTLDVRATSVKGSNITILGVSVSPNPAGEGRAVNFTVELKNNYNTKKSADVTVYLGDNLKQSKNVSIAAHATASLTLQLVPHNPGNYTWSVQVHTTNKGNSILEDSRSGELHVGNYPYVGYLKISPSVIRPNQKVNFTVVLKNVMYHGLNGITIFVKDENGNVLFSDYFSFDKIDQEKTKIYHPVISNIGLHKYTLYIKTYSEYSLNTALLSVRSNDQFLEQISFSCTDMHFDYHWSHLTYEAPLSCTAIVKNPTTERIIIDNVKIVNMSFPFSSSWVIEHPSRIDKNSTGNIVFKTTVTAGESKVLLWWRTNVWVDIMYKIAGLSADAQRDTTRIYHARYTKIHVSADKKDVVVDSITNGIVLVPELDSLKEIVILIKTPSELKKAKNAISVLSKLISFGKYVIGKLSGG